MTSNYIESESLSKFNLLLNIEQYIFQIIRKFFNNNQAFKTNKLYNLIQAFRKLFANCRFSSMFDEFFIVLSRFDILFLTKIGKIDSRQYWENISAANRRASERERDRAEEKRNYN